MPAQGRRVYHSLSQPIPAPGTSLFGGWGTSYFFLRMARRKRWELPGAKKASGQSFPASEDGAELLPKQRKVSGAVQ